ncbi:peptidoglycan/xylan/chitin deacetylase (PgdA/CDA1 family) [Rhodoligotrophos appendicifer]|uniref:polysaccharide deacetylase family protein n=1 Tax=Rhodoligotrophos appendicifer TaxID=987056 RepID=UPI001184D9B6|nr:polysaccharide deacetylase [Rhodoligotrophos appendicifer]
MTTVCLTFDFDALSLWIGTFKQVTPTPLSRGEYGARVAIDRILRALDAQSVSATFFVPGHTARTFPDSVRAIAAAGHEIGAHNDVHESPSGLSRAKEVEIMDRAEASLAGITGERPRGYRSPAWDLSPHTIELLAERGYLYDSSCMADDFTPYRPRFRDTVAEDGTISFGVEAPLWEFPVAWELDDFPYFAHVTRPIFPGLRNPEEVGEIWFQEFDYCRRHVADGVFTLTTHPQIIGRGPRILMLEQLIERMKASGDVTFSTMAAAARTQDCKRT